MARSPQEDHTALALPDPQSVARPWLGSYPPGVPPTYRYAEVPLTRFLEDAARDFPAVPATWFEGATLDYEQLRTQVVRCAAGLRSSGVSEGDRVVLACHDLPALPITLFAVLRLGAVVVLVDPTSDDLADALRTADPTVVVGGRPVLDVAGGLTDAELVAVWTRDWLTPGRRAVVTARRWWSDRGQEGRPFRDLLETGVEVPPVQVSPGATAVIVHERGARVEHTHASLVAGAFQARLWVPDVQAGKERVLLGAPGTTSFGLVAGLLAGVLSAATLVLPRSRQADGLLDAAAGARPGLAILAVESADEVASEAGGLASLRVALVDGPVAQEPARRFEVLGGVRLRPVHTSGAAGFALAAPVYGRTGPAGAMLPVTDTLAVVVAEDDPSRLVDEGEVGLLALHGPQLSPGLVDPRGWLLTSQRAVRHPGGWVEPVTARPRPSAAGGVA